MGRGVERVKAEKAEGEGRLAGNMGREERGKEVAASWNGSFSLWNKMFLH